MANARTPVASGFAPYKPPIIQKLDKLGGGPSTPASSLLSRMGTREVDDEVVAVVAWALSFFSAKPHYSSVWDMVEAEKKTKSPAKLIERIERELLDELGLEWKELPMGGVALQPKPEFLVPSVQNAKKGATK